MTHSVNDELDRSVEPMPVVRWCSAEDLLMDIDRLLLPCEVLLDIGCGIKPQKYIRPVVHICCEPFGEYVSHLQKEIVALEQRDRTYIVLKMGWGDAVRYFPPHSVDTVFLVDVIEHLEKEEGRKLLALTEIIARKQVVVFTPLGFMPQHHEGKDAWGMNGADWQEHKSGWQPKDFGDGWQIIAARDFHKKDNLSRPLERPFGAFWAIRTNVSERDGTILTRELALRNVEAELRVKELSLHHKELEINSLILARVERKVRSVLAKCFAGNR
jgi:hypothetical protein